MSFISIRSMTVLAATAVAAAASFAQQPTPRDNVAEAMLFNIPYGAPISLERADAAINAAVVEAKKRNWPISITVMDSGGNLVAFKRMDGAQLASIVVAETKARAAVTFRRETKVFESRIQEGGLVYLATLPGAIALRGGIPLVEAGKLIGSIGCSGASNAQDEVVCKVGAATINK